MVYNNFDFCPPASLCEAFRAGILIFEFSTMETVNFIATLWGSSLVIVALSLILNPSKMKDVLHALEGDSALFFHGVLRVVLGVAILLNYSAFDNSWKILVVLFGWMLLATGILFIYLPKKAKEIIGFLRKSEFLSIIILILVLLGCFLIYAGISL